MSTALPSPLADYTYRSATALVVVAKEAVAEGALALTLGSPDGGRLPDWSPGAHIDLHLAEGRTRQYSLCGDPQSIDFVEVGFPDAPAALDRGQVDAAWVLEPFLTQVLDEGARAVSFNYAEFHPELDIAGYFTTAQRFEEDPSSSSRSRTP